MSRTLPIRPAASGRAARPAQRAHRRRARDVHPAFAVGRIDATRGGEALHVGGARRRSRRTPTSRRARAVAGEVGRDHLDVDGPREHAERSEHAAVPAPPWRTIRLPRASFVTWRSRWMSRPCHDHHSSFGTAVARTAILRREEFLVRRPGRSVVVRLQDAIDFFRSSSECRSSCAPDANASSSASRR